MFERDFPYFLSIGMTYEQYWYGDTRLVYDYIEAQKFRLEQREYEMWLQGAYFREALQSALSVSEFFRAKGARPTQYPQKPYGVWERKNPEIEAQKEAQRAEAERLKAVAYFDALKRANNARRGNTQNTPAG